MKNKSNLISKGGLFTGLSVIFLYLSFILPTNKLGFLILTSALIILTIKTIGFTGGLLSYISTGVLSLIIGLKSISLAYVSLFGLYPIIKYKVEGLRNIFLEILLKLLFLNLSLFLNYYIYKSLFMDINLMNMDLLNKLPIPLIIILIQGVFLLMDYILTLIIQFINEKLKFL